MIKNLYTTDENKHIAPKTVLLVLLALYGIWQMGIVYFSGTSLSLYGRTPVLFDGTTLTIVFVLGYIVSIALNTLLLKHAMLFAKIALFSALLLTLLMFLPIDSATLSIVFYASSFFCVFLIGTSYVLETCLFDNKTELRFVVVSSIVSGLLIAVLQSDFFHVSFLAFNIISALILCALIFTLFAFPSTIEAETITYKQAKEGNKIPRVLLIGLYAAIFISTLTLVFGTALSETVTHGVSIFYLSGAVGGLVVGYLVLVKKASPFKVYTYTFALNAVGYVFATLSSGFSSLIYPALVLLGTSSVSTYFCGFFSNTMFQFNPIKIRSQLITLIGLVVALLEAAILEALRDNLSVLFATLSIIGVSTLVGYLTIETTLSHHWSTLKIKPSSHEPEPETTDEEKALEEEQATVEDTSSEIPAFKPLSPRERELVGYILSGYTNGEMAKLLFLSENTVKSYRKDIYFKLDIHSRRELFALAEQN